MDKEITTIQPTSLPSNQQLLFPLDPVTQQILSDFIIRVLNTQGSSITGVGSSTGDIKFQGHTVIPTSWLLCDGSAISRSTYSALFAVISTSFGVGDGSTTFNIPDFRRRVPMGSGGTVPSGGIANTVGTSGGEEFHQLTVSELASHQHGSSLLQVQGGGPINPGSGGGFDVGSTSFTGNDSPHNTVQPSLVVCYIIKT
jgi:microcystin-dependent protein